ncbi:hypothetical protein PVK06_043953 [Gossypium arboreum]|uniref:Enolpyruvate transferase domain-containing protein n=1 Tax=Gossypium arboreum TaxID=29729 RepID=A0ABR0MPS6_GOSAR|nr:hypothetical protein PVK06_043953 [Gossypium arboreum]
MELFLGNVGTAIWLFTTIIGSAGGSSSLYLSVSLMAAPLAHRDVEIEIIDKLISSPYVEMTIKVMERSPGYAYVEGDAFSASYFLAGTSSHGWDCHGRRMRNK